ncbi:MAG: hypothetical protein ACRDTE_24035 [Pseudonocardiaceae bacterium]
MSAYRARRSYAPEGAEQHRTWLSLIEVSGPFLSLPVLRSTWPTLDALDKPTRERLRLDVYSFWTKARAARGAVTAGDEGEDFFTAEARSRKSRTAGTFTCGFSRL